MNGMLNAALTVMIVGAITIALVARRLGQPKAALRVVVGGLVGIDIVAVLICVGIALLTLTNPTTVLAQEPTATPTTGLAGAALGAALATGLACIGAGIAVGIAGAAAIGGITEKPEILGRTLIFVGLAEGIAIYGLIISFMILTR
jgi:V/A-type H+/Na+-transporting ATPase subunit K